MNEELIKWLKHTSDAFEPPMCPLHRFILECGKDYIPAKRPKGMRKQEDKMCFRNASNLVIGNPKLEYVEGFAIGARIGWPTHHAWCVDEADHVVDVTWLDPELCQYRGVVIPKKRLIRLLVEQEYYGVLDNGISINMDLIEELRKIAA